MQRPETSIVRIAPIDHVKAARLHQAPQLRPLRRVARRDGHVDRPVPQDRKGDVHLRGAMLVVLPQGPGHPWQGGQEAAIDGGQLGQRLLVGQRHMGAQLGPQRGQDLVQQRRVEDVRCFTERAQRRPTDAEALLHLGQRRRLLQAAQAGHRRVEKVQQHQGRILIVKQLPVAGAIPLGADGPQMGEERPEHAKVLEALEGLLRYRRKRCSGHAGLLVTMMPTFLAESTACPPRPLPLAKFVPNTIAPPWRRAVAHVGDAGQAKPHLDHHPLSLLRARHTTPIRKLNDPARSARPLTKRYMPWSLASLNMRSSFCMKRTFQRSPCHGVSPTVSTSFSRAKLVCNTVKCFARRPAIASSRPASVSQKDAPEGVAEPQEGGAVGVGQEAAVGSPLEEAVAIERVGAGIRLHLHIAFTMM